MSDHDKAIGPAQQGHPQHEVCLECGKHISPSTPHGVCSDCSLRNLLNNSLERTGNLGSHPLIDHPEMDVTIDLAGHVKLVDPLGSGEIIGNFQVIRRLGRGGMGTVYEAQDSENQRRVALKVLNRPVENEAARQRFLREGRLAASINHPNSVFVFGTHQLDRLSLISMELVGGGTLEQRILRNGPMRPREAIDVALQLIDGLDAAYSRGILHRDIKPANCFEASDGTVKVGDFGLSISTDADFDSRVTNEGTILGTPAYSSPEQLRGEALDVRSDIYAFGVTLYFLLTGRTPYQADSLVKLLSQVFESAPTSPRSIRPGISQELSQIVMRCLAKEPGDRFRSYTDLRTALIPYSSQIPEPASLGWRSIAGILDWGILTLLGMSYTAVTSLAAEPVMDTTHIASRVGAVAFMAIYILYFAAFETLFGQSVGKMLLGLRTIGVDGGRPTIGQAVKRAAVFVLFPSLIALPYNFLYQVGADTFNREGIWELLPTMLVGLSFWGLWAAMFSTARVRNGLAGLHGLFSGTRVVSVVLEMPNLNSPTETKQDAASQTGLIGPYQLLESLATSDGAELHIAYDPVLLRRVWLRSERVPLTDVQSQSRSNLSRSTRLRWLNRITDQDRVWDVYEAPGGGPLIEKLQLGKQTPDQLRRWLCDLAGELSAALDDGSVPALLSIDQLWLTDSGRLKILDFVAPGISASEKATATSSNPQPKCRCSDLLKSLAPILRKALLRGDASRLPPPLHVTQMLAGWEQGTELSRSLALAHSVATRRQLSPKKRRTLMAAACYALPLVQIAFVFAYQILCGIFFTNNEDIRELRSLMVIMQSTEPFKDAWKLEETIAENSELEPELGVRIVDSRRYDAARTLVAGKYQGILDDPRMKSVPAMMHLFPAIRARIAAVQAELQPTPSEVAAAAELLAEDILQDQASRSAGLTAAFATAFFFAFITWGSYIAFPAVVAGLLFRGGPVVHGFQTTIVRMNGNPAGRFRIFLRALIAAVPGVAAPICLVASGAVATSVAPLSPAVGATAVGIAVCGALVSNFWGYRSIADRVVGTAVVSK